MTATSQQQAPVVLADTIKAPVQEQAAGIESKRMSGLRSVFLAAAAIFFSFNVLCSFTSPFVFDPYKFNYRGWSWWTFKDLRENKKINNVAVLGSSTMVSAHAGCDANYLNKNLDLTRHHQVGYLQDKLTKIFSGSFETFSLAAPGQMPSDAYISLKAMVATACRPDILIYGLAPRDFIDSTLAAPGDTDAFKYLTRVVNIDDVAYKVFRSPLGKLDWCLQRVLYLYGYSLDIRLAFDETLTSLLDQIAPRPFSRTPFTWWDRRALFPAYLPAEVYPAAIMAGPIDYKTAITKYTDNTLEYVQRYRNPDIRTYKTQMFFLAKMAEFCHKERIELILVNMPVTLQNISLLKPGGYIGYLQGLKEFALANNVAFCDLNNFERYKKTDFHDSVHLNAFGGQKFFDDLCTSLVADHRLNQIVALSGEHLAKQRSLCQKHVDIH